MQKRLYSIDEAAGDLGYGRRKVVRLMHDGHIKWVRDPQGGRSITAKALDEYVSWLDHNMKGRRAADRG